jgi:hypothetical protein
MGSDPVVQKPSFRDVEHDHRERAIVQTPLLSGSSVPAVDRDEQSNQGPYQTASSVIHLLYA